MTETILGIANGVHDTGAALIKDGELVRAINEERLSRTKRESRSPVSSVNWILNQESNIDTIAVTANPPTLLRSLKIEGKRALNSNFSSRSFLQKIYNNYRNPDENIEELCSKLSKYTNLGEQENIINKTRSYDHHKAHAASAYYTSPWDSATALTMDAAGDGVSSAVYSCQDGRLERMHTNDTVDSLGMTWAALPTVFGFKGARHAGKFMGLAEYADEYPESLRVKMKEIISIDGMSIYNNFRRNRGSR